MEEGESLSPLLSPALLGQADAKNRFASQKHALSLAPEGHQGHLPDISAVYRLLFIQILRAGSLLANVDDFLHGLFNQRVNKGRSGY